MSRLVVFATAFSRLHADLMIVRLRRAGISAGSISALYPPASKPNSGLCWLGGSARLPLSSGEAAEVSGRLRISLAHAEEGAGHTSLSARLGDLGLTRAQCSELEESLREHHLVLAIEIRGEARLTAVFQILQSLEAERIMPVSTHTPMATSAASLFRRASAGVRTAAGLTGLPAFT
jgi:hypothetical protein